VPNESDFGAIKNYVREFELDDRDLFREQFLIAKKDNILLGFGRIRVHDGCDEFCTLGIVASNRGKGTGRLLVQAIISSSKQPLYLACVIPKYFLKLGFVIVSDIPTAIQQKLNYCNEVLPVEQQYLAMKLVK
jgi:N-acetylglutamate synthase-like GNAT family acetyltransferase